MKICFCLYPSGCQNLAEFLGFTVDTIGVSLTNLLNLTELHRLVYALCESRESQLNRGTLLIHNIIQYFDFIRNQPESLK